MSGGPRMPRPTVLADIADKCWSEWAAAQQMADQVERTAGPNTGTIDPEIMPLLRGAARLGAVASEPEHYKHGYVDGYRIGVRQALFLGFMLGGAVVGIAVQLGATAGGWL